MSIWSHKLLPDIELAIVLNNFEITNNKHYFGAYLLSVPELLRMSREDVRHRAKHVAFLPFDYGYAVNVDNVDPGSNSEGSPRIFGIFWDAIAN